MYGICAGSQVVHSGLREAGALESYSRKFWEIMSPEVSLGLKIPFAIPLLTFRIAACLHLKMHSEIPLGLSSGPLRESCKCK